ncbi:hypothetical protein O7623_09505 [Solwaraspora sp. WMMD791]|uniref:hypothetical protein n=1 Tax=Solwaraspora sp. WMMD791 TaxID=3016086 RepID=UPI00249CBE7E|nr:hypothetical protein [Solwaraspora sp. WMMD791]WFE29398.1 hypothetical protein O7623_09505 [Solwaraspora sp. WMMD791]
MNRLSRPASTPTEPEQAGAGSIRSSQSRETNQRPARSCDTVTVDSDTPSGRGRDQTLSNGSDIFARVSRPSRHRNALAVYSADRRDLCRSACCNGTDDTSARNANSSVFFHDVSIAEVAL